MRIAIRFAYDADFFESYARDPARYNVEDCLWQSLERGGYQPREWRTGSRTDRGVSALENVARVDIVRDHLRGFVPELQAWLPDGLWVTSAMEVPHDWNPRHAHRTYAYLAPKQGEDLALMQRTAQLFEGVHHMGGFARLDGGRDPMRKIVRCVVEEHDDWVFLVTGRGFLWNQVRRMVQAMLLVGRGRYPIEAVQRQLKDGKQHIEFGLAPASGLLLERVDVGLAWPDAPLPQKYFQELASKRRTQLRLATRLSRGLQAADEG